MPPKRARKDTKPATAATSTDDRSVKFNKSKEALVKNIKAGARTEKDSDGKKYTGAGDVRTGEDMFTFKSLMCNKASSGYYTVKDQISNITAAHTVIDKAQLLGYLMPYTKGGNFINNAEKLMKADFEYGGPNGANAPFKISTMPPGMKKVKREGGGYTIEKLTPSVTKRIEKTFERLTEHMYNTITTNIYNSIKDLKCVAFGQKYAPLDKKKGFTKKVKYAKRGKGQPDMRENATVGSFYLKARLRRGTEDKPIAPDAELATSIGLNVTKHGKDIMTKAQFISKIGSLSIKESKPVTELDYRYYVKQAVSNGAKNFKDIHTSAKAAYEQSGNMQKKKDMVKAEAKVRKAAAEAKSAARDTAKSEKKAEREAKKAAREAKKAEKAEKAAEKKPKKTKKGASPKKAKKPKAKGSKGRKSKSK